jgi:capsular exopolysaccharide synthesis family protein
MAGEGKTTTSTNLAVVLAQAGHRVALVDADLRRPRVHEVFDIPQTPGFTDLLLGMDAKQVVNHVDIDGGNRLSVYTSGTIPSNPSEMLSGRRVRQLLNEMGGHYDYVVVDSAPVLPVSDSVALAGSVDGLLVVAHAGRVTQPNVVETLERLERIGAPILGLVLNQATQKSKGYYAYGGYGSPPPSATSMNPQPGRQEPVDFDRSSI